MPSSPQSATALLSLADKVRGVALEGLKYAKDPYDKERYESLLQMAAGPFAEALALDFDRLLESFRREIGCITPKLGTEAAVVTSKGELLVLNRADKTGWCLPCGWVNVGEDPAEAAVREVREETGLRVKAQGCISISTKGPGLSQNIQHQVDTIIAMELLSDPSEIKLNHEHTDYKWIGEDAVLPWHPGHDKQVRRVFNFIKGDRKILLPVE